MSLRLWAFRRFLRSSLTKRLLFPSFRALDASRAPH
jgi:hypothetical protein